MDRKGEGLKVKENVGKKKGMLERNGKYWRKMGNVGKEGGMLKRERECWKEKGNFRWNGKVRKGIRREGEGGREWEGVKGKGKVG